MNLAAVFPPVCTPFDRDEVDAKAIAANAARYLEAGVGGLVVLGSNGEAPLLEEDESDRVIAAARDAVPRGRLVIAGTGRESTRAAIAASRRAAALGADAVLVRTPSYFKTSLTQDAFIRHYEAVADATPVPVLLYNYPAVTGVNLQPDTVAKLSHHSNIIGIKETGSDAAQLAAYVDAVREGFSVICGSAPVLYSALCLGATGAILALACVAPEPCVAIFEHVRAGRRDEARSLQREVTPLARLVTSKYGVAGLKTALDLAGYVGGDPRAPLGPVSAAGVEEIRSELARTEHLRSRQTQTKGA